MKGVPAWKTSTLALLFFLMGMLVSVKVFRPKIINLIVDGPVSKSNIIYHPVSLDDAIRDASDTFHTMYKVGLCMALAEGGSNGNELGVQGFSAKMSQNHPYYTQAYRMAAILADRQKEFCDSPSVRKKFSAKQYAFIAYVCYRWAPASGWERYYWSEREKYGVAYFYHHYSAQELERKLRHKRRER